MTKLGFVAVFARAGQKIGGVIVVDDNGRMINKATLDEPITLKDDCGLELQFEIQD